MKSLWRLLPLFLILTTMSAADVTAVMKSSTVVYRLKGSNGAFLGQIQPSGGVLAVGCDGETIAVLSPHGVSRYNAENGAFMGQMQPGAGCTGVQVTGGVILVQSPHLVRRYNAKNGAFMGQSQF